MKSCLVCIFSILTLGINAQDIKSVNSKINEATVFFNGAELTHTASATLAKGESEIVIEGISQYIDENSLRIKATNSVVVSSSEISINYLSSSKESSPVMQKLEDSIALVNKLYDKLRIDHKINSEMTIFLQTGTTKNVSGSPMGLTTDQLMKTMEYFKTKSEELQANQTSLNAKWTQYQTTLSRLQSQLSQEQIKGRKVSGVIKLKLSAPSAVNTAFTITYFTKAASWTPYYDINITATNNPIVIKAKSKVQQTTGLDWEKVKLTLSTSTPSNGRTAPLFSTWFLREQIIVVASNSMVKIPLSDDDLKKKSAPIEEVVVVGDQMKRVFSGAVTTITVPPLVIIDGQPSSQQALSSIDPSSIKSTNRLKSDEAKSIYGSKASGGAIVVTLKKDMNDYVISSDNVMNVVYNIELPYTIPGNGKVQNIDLQTKQTPAEYKYYCAPKLDPATYLIAEISDWEKLGLLNGAANVTYDGTYVGATYINASSTHEKLSLTLGTDKRVAVKREKMQDFSSSKILGSDVQQIFTYKITVKNNQNNPVNLVLKEQYPISTQKSFEVLLRKETTPWAVNKQEVGVVTWEEEIAAGETKVYQISYSVKYPKEVNLNL